jgi:hypothetical protein
MEVKSLFIMIILFISFLSTAIAEASCFCLDEGADHIAQDLHSGPQEKEDQEHCSHSCLQCHFVAIEAPRFLFQTFSPTYQIFEELNVQYPPGMSRVLYRPPIV